MKLRLWVRKSRLYARPEEIEKALNCKDDCGEIVFLGRGTDPYGLAEPYYIIRVGRLVKPQKGKA